jgi:hypothetical protein
MLARLTMPLLALARLTVPPPPLVSEANMPTLARLRMPLLALARLTVPPPTLARLTCPC